MKSSPDDHLSTTFAALADPTRRAILARLASGEATVGDLAAPFEISLPAVSRHLKVLERAGLIEREIDAQWRRCRLTPEPLAGVADWIEAYRVFWEARFDDLETFLTTGLAPAPGVARPATGRKARQTGRKNDR